MNSTRFPGKILKKIKGKRILDLVIERVSKSKKISSIVILTSTSFKDNEISKYCEQNSINYFRGSEKDVLSRFYKASKLYNSTHYLRINSDCPFIDWNLIDSAIDIASKDLTLDYVSTILSNTFPIGQHVEVFKKEALIKNHKFAKSNLEREHVTPFIYNNNKIFKIYNLKSSINLSHIRLTVDYPKDLLMAEELLKKCNTNTPKFDEIISILKKHPQINEINNEYTKSQYIDLKNDE